MKTILILFCLGLFLTPSARAQMDLKTQISEVANHVLMETETSKTYSTASASLDLFFEKLLGWSQESTFQQAFCQAMLNLNDTDLLLFQTQLNERTELANAPCVPAINERIQSYLNSSKSKILEKSQLFRRKQRTKDPSKFSGSFADPNDKLGPSLERPIDAKLGGVYFAGDLPVGHFALTFDDGPHSSLTEKLLHILKEEDVQATFFMVGQRIVTSTPIISRMVDEGHTVATHSYSHADLTRLPFEKGALEVQDAFKALYAVIGDKMSPFFRFPYGARTKALQAFVKGEGIATFFWNVDTLDWKKRDPAVLFDYALEQTLTAQKGIILFHDVQPQTIAIMPEFLKALKVKGFKIEVFRQKSEAPLP